MSDSALPAAPDEQSSSQDLSLAHRLRRIPLGRPRNLAGRSLSHHLTLVPFLAWGDFGDDGPSSVPAEEDTIRGDE